MNTPRTATKGQSLVEFAVLLPLLLLILAILVELGFLFQDHMVLNDQVRELGRYAAKGHDFYDPDPIDENCGLFDVARNLGLSDDNSAVRVTYITVSHESGLALVVGRQSASRGLVGMAEFAPVDPTEMVKGHQKFLDTFGTSTRDIVWVAVNVTRWHKTFTPLLRKPALKITTQTTFRVARIRLK